MKQILCPKCGEELGTVNNGSMISFYHCGISFPSSSYPDLKRIRYGSSPIGDKYTELRRLIRWLESKENDHRRTIRYLNEARAHLNEVIKMQDASVAHGISDSGGKLHLNTSQKNKVETAREMLRAHAVAQGFEGELDSVDQLRAYCKLQGLPELV